MQRALVLLAILLAPQIAAADKVPSPGQLPPPPDAKVEAPKPDAAKVEPPKVEAPKPDATKPDATKPDAAKPADVKADAPAPAKAEEKGMCRLAADASPLALLVPLALLAIRRRRR